jgi:hypothetical protein
VEEAVALDRGLREALGISDGECAVIHAWDRPNAARRLHRLGFSTRSVFAHPSVPLRADLEKPVCRLSTDAMTAIGARDGDRVVVEALVRTKDAAFERRTVAKRVLTIDAGEAERRALWVSHDADEGYIDCAEWHGIFPPFPTIYLDFFDMRALFGGGRGTLTCPVVQVRPKLASRFADDASEFAWVGVIGLVAVLVQAANLPLLVLVLVAVVVVAILVTFRVRRSIR